MFICAARVLGGGREEAAIAVGGTCPSVVDFENGMAR